MKKEKTFTARDKGFIGFALFFIVALLIFMGFIGSFDIPNWKQQQLMMNTVGSYSLVPATATNSALSFGTGIYSKHICIINDSGTNEIYFDLNDTVATTSNIQLKAGERWEENFITGGIGIICASGKTASVRVIWTY